MQRVPCIAFGETRFIVVSCLLVRWCAVHCARVQFCTYCTLHTAQWSLHTAHSRAQHCTAVHLLVNSLAYLNCFLGSLICLVRPPLSRSSQARAQYWTAATYSSRSHQINECHSTLAVPVHYYTWMARWLS